MPQKWHCQCIVQGWSPMRSKPFLLHQWHQVWENPQMYPKRLDSNCYCVQIVWCWDNGTKDFTNKGVLCPLWVFFLQLWWQGQSTGILLGRETMLNDTNVSSEFYWIMKSTNLQEFWSVTIWGVKASSHTESKFSFSWALLKCSTFFKSSNILFNIIRLLPVELKIEYILVTHQMNKPIQTLLKLNVKSSLKTYF